MGPEIEILCIGAPIDAANAWIFQELLFLGFRAFKQTVLEQNIELFRAELQKSSKWVFCIGGNDSFKKVASEFLDKTILWLPEDLQKIPSSFYTKTVHFTLISEDELKKTVQASSNVDAHFYSYEGTVSVVMSSSQETSLEEALVKIRSLFSSYEISSPMQSIALKLQNTLVKQHKTVAFAESCTGGFLSHLMTSNAGSSLCFLGSFVTYSNVLKREILGVEDETLTQYGAVSGETVGAMLKGVFDLTQADFAIAVSGVAGPDGGTEKTPVGTVYFAIGEKGHVPEIGSFQILGTRKQIIALTSYRVLSLLYKRFQVL